VMQHDFAAAAWYHLHHFGMFGPNQWWWKCFSLRSFI